MREINLDSSIWKSTDGKISIRFGLGNKYDCTENGKSYIGTYTTMEADENTLDILLSNGPMNLKVWMAIGDDEIVLESRISLKKISN